MNTRAEIQKPSTDADPATALMTRFYAATENPADLHDPIGVAIAYENVLGILQL